MIDHVSVPVRDLDAAAQFDEAVLGTLGMLKMEVRPATVGFGKKYPEFWINLQSHYELDRAEDLAGEQIAEITPLQVA